MSATRRPKAGDVVFVEWEDACAHTGASAASVLDIAADYEPYMTHTVGFLVRRDKKVTMVVNHKTPDHYSREAFNIPSGMVRALRVLKRGS